MSMRMILEEPLLINLGILRMFRSLIVKLNFLLLRSIRILKMRLLSILKKELSAMTSRNPLHSILSKSKESIKNYQDNISAKITLKLFKSCILFANCSNLPTWSSIRQFVYYQLDLDYLVSLSKYSELSGNFPQPTLKIIPMFTKTQTSCFHQLTQLSCWQLMLITQSNREKCQDNNSLRIHNAHVHQLVPNI